MPITDHLRDYALDLEKYNKVVKFYLVWEGGNQEDCNFFNKFIPYMKLL